MDHLTHEQEIQIFQSHCKNIGIILSEKQISQFVQYYELLKEWNSFMNLTAITEFPEVLQKHFEDSLTLARSCDISAVRTVLDVGTGAGFPGIPLKIAYPHLKVVLLDSLGKRVKFLNHVIDTLGLSEITAVHGRAEDYARQRDYREQFDLVASRAVANLSSLCEYCLPYVKQGGCFISYKSQKLEEELDQAKNAIGILGGKLGEVNRFFLEDSDMERALVIIKKTKETPKKYPRKAGIPSKEPLC